MKSTIKASMPSSPPVEQTAAPDERDSTVPKKKGAETAAQIIAGTADPGLAHYARALESDNPTLANQAARVIDEVIAQKPELVAPYIERLVRLLTSANT